MHPSAYEFATTALAEPRQRQTGSRNRRVQLQRHRPAPLETPTAPPGTSAPTPSPAPASTWMPRREPPQKLSSPPRFVTTEMLEHAVAWRAAVTGMVRVLAPGGGRRSRPAPRSPYHPHPDDHWRSTLDQMAAIAAACGLDYHPVRTGPRPGQPRRVPPRRQARGERPPGTRTAREGRGASAAIEPGPPRCPITESNALAADPPGPVVVRRRRFQRLVRGPDRARGAGRGIPARRDTAVLQRGARRNRRTLPCGCAGVRKYLDREQAIRLAVDPILSAASRFWPDVILCTSAFFIPPWLLEILRDHRHKIVMLMTKARIRTISS